MLKHKSSLISLSLQLVHTSFKVAFKALLHFLPLKIFQCPRVDDDQRRKGSLILIPGQSR